MFAPMPIGLALLAASLAYFHFFGSKLLREDGGDAVTPARTQSYFARAYGIEGDVHELTVTVDSPLVGMSLGDAEALQAHRCSWPCRPATNRGCRHRRMRASGSAACSARWGRSSR